MNTQQRLVALHAELDAIYEVMPENFGQMQRRDQAAFLISREIEKLENPEGYAENENHWDGHELRF